MYTALFAVMRLIELEQPELDCAFCECGVEVQHVIAAVVVVFIPAVIGVIFLIPDVLSFAPSNAESNIFARTGQFLNTAPCHHGACRVFLSVLRS